MVAGSLHLMDALTDDELAMLAFERQWFRYQGAKDALIMERFGMTAARYYMVLNSLIDRPEALAADPMTTRRLLRLRDARRELRSSRRAQAQDS